MFIGPEKLAEIKSSVDIVDIITDYVPLKKAGKRFRALCPFHEDKDPSFYVNPERQNYKCFGCGVSGDVISFLEAIDHLTFSEAVSLLARRAGVQLDLGKPSGDTSIILKANEFACKFYEHILHSTETGKAGRDYLLKRNISEDIAKTFRIGYAPPGWESLKKAASKEGMPEKDLLKAGLLIESNQGGVIDFFRQRVIFPIQDARSRVIAFGGRVLDDSLPKYMNSSDSPVFKKSGTLYGMNLAKDLIFKKREAIITEGYTDVIKAHEKGFSNTVATLGTAFTDNHARLLRRYADTVYVVFDSDSAGKKAAERSLEILLGQELDIRVIQLPGGSDLFDLLSNKSTEEFQKLQMNAADFLEFKYQSVAKRHNLTSNKGRADAADELLEILKSIANPVLRDLEIRKVANLIGTDASGLKTRLGYSKTTIIARSKRTVSTEELRDMDLIGIMLNRPDMVKNVKEAFPPECYHDTDYGLIAAIIYEEFEEKGAISTNRIFESENGEDLRKKVVEIVNYCGGPGKEERDYEKLFAAWVSKKEKELLERELKSNPDIDLKEYFELKKKANRKQKV